MGCGTPDLIQKDLEDWAASTRAPVHANMDYNGVMPASNVIRRDACEWDYSAQYADRGSSEPASGRPLWDTTQHLRKRVHRHSDVPTMLPRAVLWASALRRPLVPEEHALLQGVILSGSGRVK